MPKKFAFIDLVFNSSYRKIIDNKNKDYTIYKDYIIDLDSIENNITDLLVKNKKLLSDIIIEFKYNNEIFNNEVTDLITLFKKNYEIIDINIDDKVVLYNFVKDYEGNNDTYRNVINDFITLLQYLNKLKKEDVDNNVKGDSIIYEVNEKLSNNMSKEFLTIFKDKRNLLLIKFMSYSNIT